MRYDNLLDRKHACKQTITDDSPAIVSHHRCGVGVCRCIGIQKAKGGPTGTCRINTSVYKLVPEDQSQFDFSIFGKRRESLNKPTCAHQLGGYSRTYPHGCSLQEITRSQAQ